MKKNCKEILVSISLGLFSLSIALANPKIGEIPAISDHYKAVPVLYHLEYMPKETLSPLIARQYVMGSNVMVVRWVLQKGAIIPLHYHVNEQVILMLQGAVRIDSQGNSYIVKAGDTLVIPPNVPHASTTLENNTIAIDIFSPVRQDWLEKK